MDRVVNALNNRYVLAAISALFLIGLFRKFAVR
jgi:hypothetical protein